jgi:small-conductance mechanosensitive channel
MNRTDTMLDERLLAFWNDSQGWLTANWGRIIVAAVVAGFVVILLLGLKWLGARLAKAHAEQNHWRRITGSALAKTRLWFIAAVAAQVVATYSHAPEDLAKTVYFVFVIAATLQSAVFVREVILGWVEHRSAANGELGSAIHVIRLLVTFALFAVAIILILSNLGVNVTGLITGLGIGGIAIGLAAQGIFKDLFAALSILFDRPFRVSDLIRFGDVTGRVESIGLKTTRIRALDGEEVIMSNDKLLDQQIRNFHGIEQRRITLALPLHYANSAAKLEALPHAIEGVIGQIPDSRFTHALLTSFEANAVTLEIQLHSTEGAADVRDRVRHQAICATLAYLERERISLSYQATDRPGSQADVVERQ